MNHLRLVSEKTENDFSRDDNVHGGIVSGMNAIVNELACLAEKNSKNLVAADIAKAYLGRFVEKADIPLVWVDKDLRVLKGSASANAWLKKFHGKKNKKIEAKKPGREATFGDNDSVFTRAVYEKVERGETWRKKMLKWPIAANRYRWLNMEVSPLRGVDGYVSSFLMSFEDVTKYRELESSNKRLRRSNELLESYNLIFSHDLIQPLRQIANFSEILRRRCNDYKLRDPEIEQCFNGIDRGIEHVRNLSEGVALYCRRGELSAASEKLAVKKFLENILSVNLRMTVDRFRLRIEEGVKVIANPITVAQLFQNLFVNAVKYSEEGSPITLAATREGDYVKFYLHNYGYCSRKLRSQNVFNVFESSRTDGAGVGLMICKRVVEAYSGRIFLRSRRKSGTLVTFTLPSAFAAE